MNSHRRHDFVNAGLLASSLIAASLSQAEDTDRMRLPTGQFATPTVLPDAVQQFLNPGLANYPNFVANEAVRSQLSPDGTTLLILCAGYNNNLDKNAQSDLAASNQYIFVYNVAGPLGDSEERCERRADARGLRQGDHPELPRHRDQFRDAGSFP